MNDFRYYLIRTRFAGRFFYNEIFVKKNYVFIQHVFFYFVDLFLKIILNNSHKKTLHKILQNNRKQILLFSPTIPWNGPLFQRPQQLALSFAKHGFLVFYATTSCKTDNVFGFRKITNNLFLTNRMDLVQSLPSTGIIYFTSTALLNVTALRKLQASSKVILYDYIDAIHPALSGGAVENAHLTTHKTILKDENIIVVSTADKLHKEVLKYRSKNCLLATNGVDYKHFSKKFSSKASPKELHKIIQNGFPVIGYFGALASWFDYNLVIKAAKMRPKLHFVLIGWNYDSTLNKYKKQMYNNISIIGPRDYLILPKYASLFDVSIIPFKINKVTESTSPVKLFEYMALGKPIVTTNLPECRKYKSVLIGKNGEEFVNRLDEALKLRNNKNYLKILKKEALENTWDIKVKDIKKLLSVNLNI
ncbi:hypothetical protein A3J19_01840 [Candidatus Daviesbacteria bacterium RIFCSPLOWO2_02_FULL_41_8]|uniref:Glycosyl transferase family 1 domain-containing protein n=3 Tax=Candidatus Daviesiibacteriota TaxID=1752718 RepID=A0A1F5NIF0_9BACT|nr:MAG: hypothetical protein A2871_00905 [Candidatus Daviesbacteria bacterium RIFCSPHIGHO2_01_FULL_41_23]OGE32967.1 MAG: hypothetical protein A3D83_04860 [Candidatus Daviesbacteria bacterium RIFCSPHIGHO2_02_FULL_41_10]OGE62453.1 MAG: hypothetical protein A2967_01390 [Candidatus Daviesbacteria bacterium RIFCSPLOWO2_01_FULL_41_32]OGE77200.1 MAG: hypothetical protein A3J19_01840 [Candidatus Daviesbacteria bacterium RIFCSPLOWO2_02_FULL_41_8]